MHHPPSIAYVQSGTSFRSFIKEIFWHSDYLGYNLRRLNAQKISHLWQKLAWNTIHTTIKMNDIHHWNRLVLNFIIHLQNKLNYDLACGWLAPFLSKYSSSLPFLMECYALHLLKKHQFLQKEANYTLSSVNRNNNRPKVLWWLNW